MAYRSAVSPKIMLCRDLEEISRRAALHFVRLANECIAKTDRFMVALAGGETPRRLYALLATEEFSGCVPWAKVHFFFGDERGVPPESRESNFRMAYDVLFQPLLLPHGNIHRIRGEEEDAAESYEAEIMRVFQLKHGEIPRFDLFLLGMGDDGHTASLFPGTGSVHIKDRIAAAIHLEKLDAPRRTTLTAPVVLNAANIMALVSGKGKAAALKAVMEGTFEPDRYPMQIIRGAADGTVWFIDEPAASELSVK